MTAATTNNMTIAAQLNLMEADVTKVLVKGSIKTAMKEAGNKLNEKGDKIASSRDAWQCEPHKLRIIDGLNPRVETAAYLEHIEATTSSMVSEGYFQDKPLAGYVSKENGVDIVYIYEGGTRLRCALAAIARGAKFETIPVSVSQEGLAMEDIYVAMVRSNEGRPFSLYEKSVMVKRLARCTWSQNEISARLGIKLPMVANMLLLMEAPYQIRELVAMETVAFTLAIEMIVAHGANALAKILEAQAAAGAAGKVKVTKRFVAGAAFEKAMKKAGPVMFSALSELKSDPGFAGLSEENRTKLVALLEELDAVKEKAEEVEQNKAQAQAESAIETA